MDLKSLSAGDEALYPAAASVEAMAAHQSALDAYSNEIAQFAEQAATAGHYGFQDACLLLLEALGELPPDATATGLLPALLQQWPALAAAYLQQPQAAAARIIDFLRQPLFNLALSAEEFALLEAQLADSNGVEGNESVPALVMGADDINADNEPNTGFARLADEAALQALPRAAREIVALLLQETASLHQCLLGIPSDAPALAAEGLEQLLENTERFIRVTQTAGFEGLARSSEYVHRNMHHFRQNPHAFGSEQHNLLQAWTRGIKGYLLRFTDSKTGRTLITLLRDGLWPSPLAFEDAAAILTQLHAAGLEWTAQEQPLRAQTAAHEDVSLQLPDDVNHDLLELLLQDLPLYTQQFSAAIQRLHTGGALQDIDAAQRVAHTLKGSANTVGIRGIAVLTHHLEDILIACAGEHKLPRCTLLNTLLDAADCLENMSDALLDGGAPPANALAVLQEILDWANRIDRQGLPEMAAAAPESNAAGSEDDGAAPPDLPAEQHAPYTSTSPFEKRGSRGIYLNKSPLAPLFQRGGLNIYQAPATTLRIAAGQIETLFRCSGENLILNGQTYEWQRRMKSQMQALDIQFSQLLQVGADLERLIDIKDLSALSAVGGKDFDPLELDQYNELHSTGRRMVEAAFDAREMAHDLKKELEQMQELLENQQRLASDTQESLMQTRLLPAASIMPRLQRSLRQTCRLTGKQVELAFEGSDLPTDGNILNALLDPLMHLLRNAVDHGIESAEERVTRGKTPNGKITISFGRDGKHVLVYCRDDGRGLDYTAIRAAAEKRGVLTPGQAVSEAELQGFILRPNFSTRVQATHTSGRGIGMDAVYAQVMAMGGTLLLHSVAGGGLSVELRLPLPLSKSHALLTAVGRYPVAIAAKGVEQILFAGEGDATIVGQESMLLLGDALYPLVKLDDLLRVSDRHQQPSGHGAVLLVKSTDKIWAVAVDALTDSRDIVIKDLSRYVPKSRGIIGATILGDGTVAAVLDLPELLRMPIIAADHTLAALAIEDDTVTDMPEVLIVDDSLSQRRALEQLLADAGFRIRSARDGIEAAELLAHYKPAIVLTDLEMPRMNGIELTAHIRAQTYGKTLPIIMITSRTTVKHRKMAAAAGIDRYLSKPVRDDELLSEMHGLMTTKQTEAYVR